MPFTLIIYSEKRILYLVYDCMVILRRIIDYNIGHPKFTIFYPPFRPSIRKLHWPLFGLSKLRLTGLTKLRTATLFIFLHSKCSRGFHNTNNPLLYAGTRIANSLNPSYTLAPLWGIMGNAELPDTIGILNNISLLNLNSVPGGSSAGYPSLG